MNDIYEGGFHNWRDVVMAFHDGAYEDEATQARLLETYPEPDLVIYANYGGGGYDGDALVVYKQGDRFYSAEGSHCSCYGLEGQWEPEEYSKDILDAVLERKIENGYSGSEYPSSSSDVWRLIRERIKMSDIAYWNFELEGILYDGEFIIKADAMRAADEQWANSVSENNNPRNGELWEDTATLYAMDEDGEVISKEDYEVEYEHYHGDYAEHFHQGDYI